jgi:hypothetical protein
MQLRGEMASGRWWRKSSMGHRLSHGFIYGQIYALLEKTNRHPTWQDDPQSDLCPSWCRFSLEICHRSLSAFCSSRGPNPKHCSCNILLLLTWSIRLVRTWGTFTVKTVFLWFFYTFFFSLTWVFWLACAYLD